LISLLCLTIPRKAHSFIRMEQWSAYGLIMATGCYPVVASSPNLPRKRIPMKLKLVTFVFLLILASTAAAQTKKSEAADWHDTTRDVFINNELDRSAQVLNADNPTRLALISSKFDTAIVLDVTEKTMSAMAKDAFHFAADRTS